MHIATVTEKNPLDLAPGEYVCEDITAGQMLANGWAETVTPLSYDQEFCPDDDWNEKKILLVRPGGFGDLLFLTPAIREIKKRWPTCKISVACFPQFKDSLASNPDIESVIQYPVSKRIWRGYDAHVWLEGIIEKNPAALNTHAVDLIAKRCGIELSDKSMRYVVTPAELTAALNEFPGDNKKRRIGVQVTASGSCRMYPHMTEVTQRLWRDGHEIFLFGRPGELKSNEPEGIVNLTAKNKTFRESCAALMTCDVLVAPDSALAHVAGALGIPCVALYGPFPWTLRTAYAPKTFAIQGIGRCSPCFHHARPGTGEFPVHGPCFKSGRCEVLAGIPVDRVIREVDKHLEARQRLAVVA